MYKIQCQNYNPEHNPDEANDFEPPWFDDPVIATDREEGNLFHSFMEAAECMIAHPTWFISSANVPHRHFYSFRIVKIP